MGFPEGLPLFKLIFFLKIKKCINLTQTVGRFDMRERESDPLPENFVVVLQLSNHKINQKQPRKLKCNKNQKFHS